MDRKDLFYFGKILKPKGYKGELKITLDVDDPSRYENLDAIFVERRRELIPFIINNIALEGRKATLKLEGIDDEEAAEDLSGCATYLPISLLPELGGNNFYFHEVEGFGITDIRSKKRGKLIRIIDLPSNPLFEVDFEGKEVLVPINDEIINKVDRKKKVIEVEVPEGLIDIY